MGAMLAYALATLRTAMRSPLTWVLLVLGTFFGWFAVSLAVLALDEAGAQAEPLTLSTAHLAGVFLTLWLVGRSIDEDRTSGFAAAADVTPAGHVGRILGRFVGAVGAGTALALLTSMLIDVTSKHPAPGSGYLLYTSILACGQVGAWGILLGTLWRGGGATLAAFLLWLLGHLPWGAAPFLDGPVGRALGAWLPGPRTAVGLEALGYTSAAVAGLMLVALAMSRPADA